MRGLFAAATLVVGLFLLNDVPAFAQERMGLLTRAQDRAYHACLFEGWIEDYCHRTSFAYPQCVIANGGGRYPLDGPWYTDDYCWASAQVIRRR